MKNSIKVFSLILIISFSSCTSSQDEYYSAVAGVVVVAAFSWLIFGLETEANETYTNDQAFEAPTDAPTSKSNQRDFKFEFAQNGEHFINDLNTRERIYLGSWEQGENLIITSKKDASVKAIFNILKLNEKEMTLALEDETVNLENFNSIYGFEIKDPNKPFRFSAN